MVTPTMIAAMNPPMAPPTSPVIAQCFPPYESQQLQNYAQVGLDDIETNKQRNNYYKRKIHQYQKISSANQIFWVQANVQANFQVQVQYLQLLSLLISKFRVMQTLVINNVTALLCTNSRFDLFYLSQRISNVVYNKRRFPGLVIRKNSPKGTFLIFQSGKIIILGCQSTKDAQGLSKKIIKTISKITNQKIQQKSFSITNILGNATLPFKINIAKLADQTNAIKHDSFPGAFYSMKKPVKAVTIYPSGKITLLGAKSKKDIEEAIQILTKDLHKFKKNQLLSQQDQSKKLKVQKKILRKRPTKQRWDEEEKTQQDEQTIEQFD